jgi:short-subunit dehydrogenase involved in D-alanine esterification of teichoic acids
MDLGIEGLRVLITAGAGGIGLKVAEAFAIPARAPGTSPTA